MQHVAYLVACIGAVLLALLGIGLVLERLRARRGIGWSVLRTFLDLLAAIIIAAIPF